MQRQTKQPEGVSFMSRRHRGFTLIELLVVIAIIGLLASIISLSYTSSRRKARDARRLTDVDQIRTGLDLYYNHGAGYPTTATWTGASSGTGLVCDGTFIVRIPVDMIASTPYVYTGVGSTSAGCGGTVVSHYKFQFTTEGNTAIGPADTYYLHPGGITNVDPYP
jgi:prepilin-type N-terminal cleavage/methylation domain-containing protein